MIVKHRWEGTGRGGENKKEGGKETKKEVRKGKREGREMNG